MTGEETAAATQNVQAYAFDKYREQGGGSLMSLLTTGMSDVIAATRAIGAATEAQALSVDPHVVDTMLKKLTEMQDALDEMARKSTLLARKTPLGGGYAEEIGAVNEQLGTQAVGDIIPELTKAVESLKGEIAKSRANYQNSDTGQAGNFRNVSQK